MEMILEFLTQIVYHSLEIIEALGAVAGELSAIHFPPIV